MTPLFFIELLLSCSLLATTIAVAATATATTRGGLLLSFNGKEEITTTIVFKTTWYGARDNCPPGGDIAYPVLHKVAGGIGTYDDPITYAGVKTREAPGTIVYIPNIAKYFIMEDSCEECEHDWRKKGEYHIDLWMGPDTLSPGAGLTECENAMTTHQEVVLNPPASGLTVNTTAVFDPSRTAENSGCIIPVQACTDDGNVCGNSCEIPNNATCAQLASMLIIPLARFVELNPTLNCSSNESVIVEGTSVCQGGTCGE